MFSKELRKMILLNRLAKLEASGKENQNIRNKVKRELKKYN